MLEHSHTVYLIISFITPPVKFHEMQIAYFDVGPRASNDSRLSKRLKPKPNLN